MIKRIITITSIALLMCSCGKIHDYEWKKACEICEGHDGVRYLENELNITTVKCNDGYYTDVWIVIQNNK